MYLAVMLDAYSRKVVGWGMADHLRTELATAALQMALTTRHPAPGLIHHTDRGSHYTSSVYGELLSAHQVRQSVGKPGTCWDNSVAESFFATLKTSSSTATSGPVAALPSQQCSSSSSAGTTSIVVIPPWAISAPPMSNGALLQLPSPPNQTLHQTGVSPVISSVS